MGEWQVWAEPWLGYCVVQRIRHDDFCSEYRYARNWLGMHKFFFTLAGAEAFAAERNTALAQQASP